VPLGLRVTTEVKEKLDHAAKASGRSQSMEAELRLEQTFRSDQELFDALDLAYGRELTGLLMILARVMHLAGTRGAFASSFTVNSPNWLDDPFAYDQCAKAVNKVLEELRPAGDPKRHLTMQEAHGISGADIEQLGEGFALNVLLSLLKPEDVRDPEQHVLAATERLSGRLRELADQKDSRK